MKKQGDRDFIGLGLSPRSRMNLITDLSPEEEKYREIGLDREDGES